MKYKLTRSQAVAFLVALGFKKAGKWEKERITTRLAQVPDKVAETDVPEGFADLYKGLVESKGVIEFKEKDAKPATSKAKGTPKPAAAAKISADRYGSRIGTISAKVNAVLSKEWQTEEAIAKEAGVTLDQARGRLYYAAQEGVVEHERAVRYRLPTS